MKATLTTNEGIREMNVNHRKENHFYKQITGIAIDAKGFFREAVTLRLYGTDARTYACIWAHNDNIYLTGSGCAGGYGNHRASEATARALESIGVTLSEEIGGRGDAMMDEAIGALVEALFPENKGVYTVLAHS